MRQVPVQAHRLAGVRREGLDFAGDTLHRHGHAISPNRVAAGKRADDCRPRMTIRFDPLGGDKVRCEFEDSTGAR